MSLPDAPAGAVLRPLPRPLPRPLSRPLPRPLLRWELGRHSSLSPGQLLGGCALPCVLSLGVGGAFAACGSPGPLAFAILQAGGMALACLVQARRGADRAVLTVRDGWLEVAKRRGSRLNVCNLPLASLCMRADARGLHLECGSSLVRILGYASPVACARVLGELEQARAALVAHAAEPVRQAGEPRSEVRLTPCAAG